MTHALTASGHHPIIVTTNDGITSAHDIQLNKWLGTSYGKVFYQSTRIHYLPIRALFRSLCYLNKVDVIHLTAIFYPLSWSIALINIFFHRKPVIWSPRGELDPDALKFSSLKKKPILWLLKTMLLRKTVFHSTSEQESKYIKKQFGNHAKIVEVPNYMELPVLLSTKKEKYLLYIGRIHPKKAIENLLKGCALSNQFKESEFVLKIAGAYNNKYGQYLKQLTHELGLQEKVIFLGHIEGIMKQTLLGKAYFSFMPSHTENFGNVVVEALAQKTPVVASTGTPWNILEERNAGFYRPNDPESLARIIDQILQLSNKTYIKYADNALKLAQQEFSIDNNINTWIKVYTNLANE